MHVYVFYMCIFIYMCICVYEINHEFQIIPIEGKVTERKWVEKTSDPVIKMPLRNPGGQCERGEGNEFCFGLHRKILLECCLRNHSMSKIPFKYLFWNYHKYILLLTTISLFGDLGIFFPFLSRL